MKKETTKKMLKTIKEVHCLIVKMQDLKFLNDEQWFGLGEFEKILLDEYGFPEDNTIEMGKKYGEFTEEAAFAPGAYCRDYLTDLLYEYFDDKITVDIVISKLDKYKSELNTLI